MTRLRFWLEAPVSPASLVVFRISFGLLLFYDVLRYFAAGWIGRYYLEPAFLFKYYGFEWVHPWPGNLLYWHFAALGLLSLMITAGAFYRLAICLFTVAFSYVYLLDQARYLNHFYLVIIICVLLCVMPAANAWSVDAWRRSGKWRGDEWIPRWAVTAMVLLFEIVLIYAGIVKVNADWLAGEPLRQWFSDRGEVPFIGPLIAGEWAVYAASWGAAVLHLVGAPLLLWRRTRLAVFCIYAAFHITNAFVFSIGIFPWMTLAATLMFFDPDWPQQCWARLRRLPYSRLSPDNVAQTRGTLTPAIILFLGIYFSWQILVPLRHYAYPGNVAWTEEGHRFAWRMKLRTKSGRARFHVTDPASGQTWLVNPKDYLTRRQVRYNSTRPDMILQFAHELERIWREEKGIPDVEVRASVWCALNGRKPMLLIDPEVDLTRVKRELWPPADWIMPLVEY